MGYDWLKLHTDGWLRGSIRVQLTPTERSIWADLLALASESRIRGTVCLSKGIPYPHDMLAATLRVTPEDLATTIQKCAQDSNKDGHGYRLTVTSDGCIIINNFDEYNSVPTSRQRETPQERELRERRTLSQLVRKYPEDATLAVTETIVVDSKSGEVLKHEQKLGNRVRNNGKDQPGSKKKAR